LYSNFVVKLAPGAFLEEILSIIRTSNIVPAGSVTELAAAGGGAAATGAERKELVMLITPTVVGAGGSPVAGAQ
jgi:hypothetical protein